MVQIPFRTSLSELLKCCKMWYSGDSKYFPKARKILYPIKESLIAHPGRHPEHVEYQMDMVAVYVVRELAGS